MRHSEDVTVTDASIADRKAKAKEASKRWYARNKEAMREAYQKNKLDPQWVEHRREQSHAYNKSEAYRQKDRARSKHPERRCYIAEKKRQYDKTFKGRVSGRIGNDRRRKRISSASGSYSADDIALLLRSQKSRCWWCGMELADTFHIDHRIPLSRGGSNAPENLCISCPKCNLSKGNKLPHEWNDRLL